MTSFERPPRPNSGQENQYYILRRGVVVPVETSLEWGLWMQHMGKLRVVGSTLIGHLAVSTVFIGIRGQIFETMIFDTRYFCTNGLIEGKKWKVTPSLDYQTRCDTLHSARYMHRKGKLVARNLQVHR